MGAGTACGDSMEHPQQSVHLEVEQELKQWVAQHAEAGVPELIIEGVLRECIEEIDALGYIPRCWGTPVLEKSE